MEMSGAAPGLPHACGGVGQGEIGRRFLIWSYVQMTTMSGSADARSTWRPKPNKKC